jgi:RNA polymerase sigma-70 factor, ECF subfamily
VTSNKSCIELVRLLKKGDINAFNAIYYKYCKKLYAFVIMYLKQEEDAEEIVQEVFIKIWQSKDKIDVSSSFESFLFTIAYNATMSLFRKRMSENKSRQYLKSLQHISSSDETMYEIQVKELDKGTSKNCFFLNPLFIEIFF